MFGRTWIAGRNESEPDGSVTCVKIENVWSAYSDLRAITKAGKLIERLGKLVP